MFHKNAIEILNEAGSKGIRVDVAGMKNYLAELEVSTEVLLKEIQHLTQTIKNPGSPKQVSDWLDAHGVEGTGSAKERLQSVPENLREVAEKISEYRSQKRDLSSLTNMLKGLVNVDGEMRFVYEYTESEKSGRMYSAVQNVSGKIRDFFLPDEDDEVVVVLDYNSQELRILLTLSGEKEMVAKMDAGVDIHMEVAKGIFGENPSDEERSEAKAVVYGLIYGQTPEGLSYRLGVTEIKAYEIQQKILKMMPGLREFMDQKRREAFATKQICTIDGFVRTEFDESHIMNTLIQGSGADVMAKTIERTNPVIKNLGGRILASVHDSLVFIVKRGTNVGEVVREMRNTQLGDIPVSMASGKTWGEAHNNREHVSDAFEYVKFAD